MADFILTVTDPGVGHLNANDRTHWSRRHHVTKAWREAAAWEARRHQLPAMTRARIVAVYRFHDKRRRDPANYLTTKGIVDGLVDAGLLPDDDHTHLIGPDLRVGPTLARGERLRVELHITDLTGPGPRDRQPFTTDIGGTT